LTEVPDGFLRSAKYHRATAPKCYNVLTDLVAGIDTDDFDPNRGAQNMSTDTASKQTASTVTVGKYAGYALDDNWRIVFDDLSFRLDHKKATRWSTEGWYGTMDQLIRGLKNAYILRSGMYLPDAVTAARKMIYDRIIENDEIYPLVWDHEDKMKARSAHDAKRLTVADRKVQAANKPKKKRSPRKRKKKG
jgi:hypothetical protein